MSLKDMTKKEKDDLYVAKTHELANLLKINLLYLVINLSNNYVVGAFRLKLDAKEFAKTLSTYMVLEYKND